MILPAEGPLSPFGWPLRALYVALNSPVVTLDAFPKGPARSGVALHEDGASLCVRSVRSGQIRWFVTTGDLSSDPRVAADAALSFGESMGFLFDEDEVARRGDAGSAEAVALWLELCGEEAPGGAEGLDLEFGDSEPLGRPAEILLTDSTDDEVAATRHTPSADAAAGPIEIPRAVLASAAVLTKFRRSPETSQGESAGPPSDLRLRLMSRF